MQAGDLILICSDGLTEMVGSYEIAGLLAAQADMHETARRLVDLANEAGGRDNTSVIVVKVTAKEPLCDREGRRARRDRRRRCRGEHACRGLKPWLGP